MSTAVLSIVLANVTYAIVGVGLAAALGAFDRRPATWVNALVGLPLGIAVIMLLSAYAALLGFALTPTVLALLAVLTTALAAWRLRRPASGRVETGPALTRAELLLTLVPAFAIAWVLVVAGRAMAVKPLVEWDGWVLWATKARVLYDHPGNGAEILQNAFYGAPSYPPGMPALEATTMHAVGAFDGGLLDLQLLALVAAAVIGIWALLHRVAHPVIVGLALLATLASSQLAYQLTTNYADVPLAYLTALGVTAGAVWLAKEDDGRPWQLASFAVFLAAAAWTKNEGLVFGTAAVVALVGATLARRAGRVPGLLAAAGFAVLVAPWRLYSAVNGLRTYDYDLADFFAPGVLRERADRVGPAAHELISEMTEVDAWGASLAVVILAIVSAALTSRRTAGLYTAGWLLLSFCGLVATYWISNHRLDNDLENSSFRTIVTLLVTGLCLAPLLVDPLASRVAAAARARVPSAWRVS